MNRKGKMKEKIRELKTLLKWVIIAFCIGMAMRAGAKALDHAWPEPDKPIVIEHRVVTGGDVI